MCVCLTKYTVTIQFERLVGQTCPVQTAKGVLIQVTLVLETNKVPMYLCTPPINFTDAHKAKDLIRWSF